MSFEAEVWQVLISTYTETFKEAAYITKIRTAYLRDLGCCLSPFNAYLTLLGLETLHLRMERHSESALKVAKWLQNSEYVKWVSYPLLESSKYYENATDTDVQNTETTDNTETVENNVVE